MTIRTLFRHEKTRLLFRQLGGPFLALIVLLILGTLTSEAFGKSTNLLNITRQVSYSGLIALGMTFVIVGGGIDLSVGSLLAFCSISAAIAVNKFTPILMTFAENHALFSWLPNAEASGFVIGLVVSLTAGAVGAALNGALIAWGRIPPFIATLGTYSMFRSLALYFADSGSITIQNTPIKDLGGAELFGVFPVPTLILFLAAIFLEILLAMTAFGRHVCALGANERAARYAGIHTVRTKFMTYLAIGLCVGVSSFLFLGRLGSVSSTNAGSMYELDAIAAVIIGGAPMSGGRGSLFGTLAGVFVLGIVSNLLDMWGISASLQGLVKGLVIVISVFIQRKEKTS